MQHLQEGAHGGWQVAVLSPNQTEVAFRLDVDEGKEPQDALLDFEGDGKARHHGNPESCHPGEVKTQILILWKRGRYPFERRSAVVGYA